MVLLANVESNVILPYKEQDELSSFATYVHKIRTRNLPNKSFSQEPISSILNFTLVANHIDQSIA